MWREMAVVDFMNLNIEKGKEKNVKVFLQADLEM